MNSISYHYLIMAQKDFLENQCLEEILRERSTYFSIRKKERDFWIILSPTFIYKPSFFEKVATTQFYNQKKDILSTNLFDPSDTNNFFVSLISLDKEFLNWLQLRLGYFENLDTQTSLGEKKFISDGLQGTLKFSKITKLRNPFKGYFQYLHPDILIKKNTKYLQLYYQIFSNK